MTSPGGRPPTQGHPAFAATDRHTGRVLSWADGQWAGDPHAVLSARAACMTGNQVPVTATGPWVDPDAGDPIGAVAVIQAVLGGNVTWSGRLPDLQQVAGTRGIS